VHRNGNEHAGSLCASRHQLHTSNAHTSWSLGTITTTAGQWVKAKPLGKALSRSSRPLLTAAGRRRPHMIARLVIAWTSFTLNESPSSLSGSCSACAPHACYSASMRLMNSCVRFRRLQDRVKSATQACKLKSRQDCRRLHQMLWPCDSWGYSAETAAAQVTMRAQVVAKSPWMGRLP
jgi:hypothetical protein